MARFVNLHRILAANREQSEQMGQRVVDEIQPDLTRGSQAVGTVAGNPLGAPGTAGAGQAVASAEAKLAMSGSNGGRQGMMGAGANAMDAWMAANSQTLGQTRQRFSGLTDRLKSAESEAGYRSQYQAQQQAETTRRQLQMDDEKSQAERDAALKKAHDDQQQARFRTGGYYDHEANAYTDWRRGTRTKLPKPLNSY